MQAITLSAALIAVANAAGATHASKVCVTNSGGYDLYWWFTDLLSGAESSHSGTYPIDQTRCMDVAVEGLAEGDLLSVYVHAVAGVTKSADTAIIYQSSPAITVTFTCNGTTLNFNCRLNGEGNEAEFLQ